LWQIVSSIFYCLAGRTTNRAAKNRSCFQHACTEHCSIRQNYGKNKKNKIDGHCLPITGIFLVFFFSEQGIRDCAKCVTLGKTFSSWQNHATPLSTNNFFNAVCTLPFCFGIQLTVQNPLKNTSMEVHDWLRQRIIFFVLFSRGFHQFNFRPIPEIKFPPDFFVSVSKCRHAGTNRQKEN
jgi:hypothetical protein